MPGEEIIRVLIVDDHVVVRTGLAAVFDIEFDIECVGEAEDGHQAIEAAHDLQPDVILMDLLMPRMDGITAIKRINEKQPEIPILVLTSFVEEDQIILAIKHGASGYLMKDTTSVQLVDAIRTVYQGEPYLPEVVDRQLRGGRQKALDQLSPLEVRLLAMIADGFPDEVIAEKLLIQPAVLVDKIRGVMNKLALESRVHAALFANHYGIGHSDTKSNLLA